jgi:uncharacterized membrane protein YeiB
MYQELQYLREELNQRVGFHTELTNKIINMVLLIWGSVIAFLGSAGVKIGEISTETTSLCFIGATIFFISNVVLYLEARKYQFSTDQLHKLAAYITVFYEKRPGKTVKVGDDFCWESANFEFLAYDTKSDTRCKKSFYKKNDEYKVLILISIMVIIAASIIFFYAWYTIGIIKIVNIILSVILIIYIIFSVCLLCKIPKYTSLKDNLSMRARHLNNFFQYALDTGYYTQEEIHNRFGKIYEICKQHSQNHKGTEKKE